MVIRIIDYISGREVYSKKPWKTAREMLRHHNDTYVMANGKIHYPENAIAEELDDVIVIRKK